ncbi:MAG: hypothetical protein ACOH2V_11435 [Candidatus Saccharimonadaceae bacterium]
MKKKFFFKFFLFTIIAALVTVTSCKNYDDDIDALAKKIEGLSSTSTSMKSELESAIGSVRASAAAAESKAVAAQTVADAAKAAGSDAKASAAAAQAIADKAITDAAAVAVKANTAQTAANAAQTKADAANTAALAAQSSSSANASAIIAAAATAKDAATKAQAAADVAANALLVAEGAVEGAQSAADAVQDTATADAHAAANAAQSVADQAVLDAAAAQAKAVKLEADLSTLMARVVALEASGQANQTQLDELAAEIAVKQVEVQGLFGKRINSITLVPTFHVNGIAAITFKSIGYIPQEYVHGHAIYGFTTKNIVNAAKIVMDDSKSTVVDFRLSPRYVTKNSIGFPYFESIIAENIKTYSVNPALAKKNSPIAPVAGQDINITTEGILKLQVTKTVDVSIENELDGMTEKFYFASLAIPVANEYLTDAEKENGGAVVTSEHYRVHEIVSAPRIKNVLAGNLVRSWNTNGIQDASPMHYRPYGVDAIGKPVHFSSGTLLYASTLNQYIDLEVDWKDGIDLNTIATVCTEENHSTLANFADYGLKFKFEVAHLPYLQGTNQTDQQQFASIDENGKLSSKVYTIDGETKTALGREPIIQVSLINTKKGNALVDMRFIKIKWYVKPAALQVLPAYTFKAQVLSCDPITNIFGTQQMNENVYRKVEEMFGVSKAQFHELYTTLKIVDLKKASTFLIKDGVFVPAQGLTASDVMFTQIPNPNDNTSFNLNWVMSPKAIGQIVPKAKETYTITVKFVDVSTTKVWGDILMDFVMDVTIPTQNFAYQGTYWQGGVGQGVFNVNPIVYDPLPAGIHGNPPAQGASHIGADLVNGYLFTGSNLKPANMAQLINQVGSCATVNFVFDKSRFGNYPHLAGYKTSADGVSLWKWNASSTPANPVNNNYIQADILAATIFNQFGATNPVLGSGVNEAKSQIRLHELNAINGTSAAKALIGKKVPVNLEVTYNAYNTVAVQKFEVHFIDPLKINSTVGGMLPDAVIGGSFVDVKTGLTFTDWNSYSVAENALTPPPAVPVKDQYRPQLFAYYAVRDVTFNTATAKTSLKLVGTTYQHVEGITNGNLPTNNSLEQVKVTSKNTTPWTFTNTMVDATHLRYVNNNGTPVNVDYSIFVDATVQYKWGLLSKQGIKIDVTKAIGTP